MMIDTLVTIIKSAQVNTIDTFDLLEKVDGFYKNAWDKLILIASVAITIVGFVVPWVIQLYQKRTLKLSEAIMKKEFESQLSKVKNEVEIELTKKVEEKFILYETKVKILNAKSYLLQGKLSLEKCYHRIALGDIIAASFGFISCEDYQNLQISMNLILNECLPNLSIEEINDLKVANEMDIESLLSKLKESDDKGVFVTVIQDIRLRMTKMPKTIKDKPLEKPKG
jgi:hypothetical protein